MFIYIFVTLCYNFFSLFEEVTLMFNTMELTDNQRLILRYIFHHRQATRNQLVDISALTLLTISKTVNALLSEEVLISDGTMSSGMGRRQNLLKLNPSYRYVLGIDIGYASVKLGVIQFNGEVLERQVLLWRKESPDQTVPMEKILQILKGYIRRFGREQLLGIGASISGMVDIHEGRVLFCPNINGFNDRMLADELSRALDLPVYLDTSARAMAYGEMLFGKGRGIRDQMLVSLGYGSIAAGIIVDGRLYHGADGFSGELGHVRIPAATQGTRCTCGCCDCLEIYASLAMVLGDLSAALAEYQGYSPAKALMGGDALNAQTLAQAYRENDAIVTEHIRSVAGMIGQTISAAVNVLNPTLVTLSGGFVWNLPELTELVRTEILSNCLVPIRSRLSVDASMLDEYAPLQGAAMQIVARYLGFASN